MKKIKELSKVWVEFKNRVDNEIYPLIKNINKYEDLKLHDINYHYAEALKHKGIPAVSEDEFLGLFEDFCEIEYYFFKEYMEEKKHVRFDYIGRTSSFYLVPENRDVLRFVENLTFGNTNGKISKNELRENIFDTYSNYCYFDSFFEGDGILIENILKTMESDSGKDILEDITEDLKGSLDMIDEIKECLQDIEDVRDYINSFKKSQLENFVEFVFLNTQQ